MIKTRSILLCIILSTIIFTPLFSSTTPALRYLGMGEAGIALFDTPTSFQINPASLYFQKPSPFSIYVAANESVYDLNTLASNDPLKTMQHPITLLEFLFATRYSALLVGFKFDVDERNLSGNSLTFTSYNDSYIQLNVAYGFSAFSAGLFLRSGSRMQRPDISIGQDNPILDYIVQVYLNRYFSSNEGQLLTTGFGILVTYPFISLAILTDSLFTLDEKTNNLKLEPRAMLEQTKLGLALRTNEFSGNNELNRFVFTTAFDVAHVTDEVNRSIHIGFEVKLQLVKDLNLSFQAGYKENRGGSIPLFGFDWDGITSFGISSQFTSIFLDVALLVPTSWYRTTHPLEPLNLFLSFQYQF